MGLDRNACSEVGRRLPRRPTSLDSNVDNELAVLRGNQDGTSTTIRMRVAGVVTAGGASPTGVTTPARARPLREHAVWQSRSTG